MENPEDMSGGFPDNLPWYREYVTYEHMNSGNLLGENKASRVRLCHALEAEGNMKKHGISCFQTLDPKTVSMLASL